MVELGNLVLPLVICSVICFGLWQKTPVFQTFLTGAQEGLKTTITLLPTLVGLITAVTMLQASGAMDWLTFLVQPVAKGLGLPKEVIPLMLIHPISGSGATAVLTNIFSHFGTDSTIGRIASVMCGSSETTVYAVTVYYGSVGVSRIGHTLPVALLSDLLVAILSGIGVRLLM